MNHCGNLADAKIKLFFKHKMTTRKERGDSKERKGGRRGTVMLYSTRYKKCSSFFAFFRVDGETYFCSFDLSFDRLNRSSSEF